MPPTVRPFMPEAASAPRAFDALTSNQLLEMYWFARLVREIEERLVILFRQSKVAPVMRVASADAQVPYSPPLESAFLPNADKVIEAATKLVAY